MEYLLSHLLQNTVARHPQRPAVEFNSTIVTYEELAARVDRLAGALRDNGMRAGDRVGVHLNKSIESVVGVLATLHAGGVFVPLDPMAPPQRVAYIVADCEIRFLVTDADKLTRLASDPQLAEHHLQAVFVAGPKAVAETPANVAAVIPWSELDSAPSFGAPERRVSTDLAYMLYTSGSTGNPKGVMISHLAALTFVQWATEKFQLTPEDVLSNHAPFHFDLSTFDLYASFKAGAKVVLLPEWASAFPGRLVKQIADKGITVWYSVPSALILMLNKGKLAEAELPKLRTILFAGEVFPIKYLRALHQAIPHARLFNLYGPTETNVCTYYEVTEIPDDRVEPFPIGKAIDNHECFAVNADGQRCGVGEEGELLVRGPGLLTGYWKLPERTAQSLHENPCPNDTEDLVYRTGDLVTLEPDGNYTYVGRIDHMVKIRGYRVELGEVEAALYEHPQVKEVAVVPVADEELNDQLRAHVALHAPVPESELVAVCAARLPKYMVPELWVFEENLPKTSTGKIDRQKLSRAD